MRVLPVLVACAALAIGCKQGRTPELVLSADRSRPDPAALKTTAKLAAMRGDVIALLFKADPVGINFETNTDEYEPEADTILPRLPSCTNAADVQKVVHEAFVHWFDPDTAGPPERYRAVARQIWERYKTAR